MNEEIVDKLISVEKEAAKEKGDFTLFGAFERQDTSGMWDIVISAPWINVKNKQYYDYFARKINAKLTPEEIVTLSRIVLLEPATPFVRAINKMLKIKHRNPQFINSVINGVFIKNAYIISSKPDASFIFKSK
ncbi:MAG: hypothetical protein H0W76_01715 [Pyrinomonadaceae bacterium]|nr:hypothetical protein [Pyrinomonadaceae bacterium]